MEDSKVRQRIITLLIRVIKQSTRVAASPLFMGSNSFALPNTVSKAAPKGSSMRESSR